MHINKYNLLNLYSITCVYNSMADQLVLDNQLGCSSLKKMTSPPLGPHWFSVPLCPCEMPLPCHHVS